MIRRNLKAIHSPYFSFVNAFAISGRGVVLDSYLDFQTIGR